MAEDNQISLRENNPYSVGYVFVFDEGDFLLNRDQPLFPKSPKDRYYTIKKGDTLWNIAHAAYGDSKWYWVIRDANDIPFALDIPVGQTLIIPDLNVVRVTLD